MAMTAQGGLLAIFAQLGARPDRRPVTNRPWPLPNHSIPVWHPARGQHLPMCVTLKPAGGEAATYDVVGTASILEEGEKTEVNQSPPLQSSKNSSEFDLASTSVRNTQRHRKASPVAQEF
jgi:hypothetical protein